VVPQRRPPHDGRDRGLLLRPAAERPAAAGVAGLTEIPLTEQLLAFARSSGIEPASAEPPRARSVDRGGFQLNVVDWGGPGERPVLFLHGGGLTARTWDLVCLALRGRFRCLALDLRGHGDSGWEPEADYRLEAYAEDVVAATAQLELDRPALVGMSLGGQTALLVAAAERLRGLVLVDVGPAPRTTGSRKIIRSLDEPVAFAGIDDAVRRAVVLNPRRKPEVLRESLKHNLREAPDGSLTWKYDWRAFAALTPEVIADRTDALWQAVPAVAAPTLIVRGAESDVFTPELAEELRGRLGDAQVAVVERAGHTVQGDNPLGLKQALEPFLERCFAA
jgi:pimeloyl-ACP methyl ester carboxylesterase